MSSAAKERGHRRIDSDAPPVQAALRGGGARLAPGAEGSGGGSGRRLARAKDGWHVAPAAESSSSATMAVEGMVGREDRRSTGSGGGSIATPPSAPRVLSEGGGANGVVPSFGADMTALGGPLGGVGGSAEKVAVHKTEEGAVEDDWAPRPSPLIFGSHSIDAAANDSRGVAGSSTTGASVGRSSGGSHRGEHTASLNPETPVSPSKGPRPFSAALCPTPRQEAKEAEAAALPSPDRSVSSGDVSTEYERPSHVWPPKPAAPPAEKEAGQRCAYDIDEEAAMPPVMVPLHRVAQGYATGAVQGYATTTASASVNGTEAAGRGRDFKTFPGLAEANYPTPPKKEKLGGKAEYAMLFSADNE